MKKLTFADTYREDEIDYTELSLLESHLAHEVNRPDEKSFVEKYRNVEYWETQLGLTGHPYLCDMLRATVEYYAHKIGMELEFDRLNKDKRFILDSGYSYLARIGEMSEQELYDLYKDSLPEYKKHGFLWSEVETAANSFRGR